MLRCLGIFRERTKREGSKTMFEQLDYTASLAENEYPCVSVLRSMEAAARIHTHQLGIDRPHMLEAYGAVWMIARCALHLESAVDTSAPLTVRTWHRGLIRGIVYRDYDLYQNGKWIGEAVQTWVLVDSVRRMLVRMDRLPELRDVPHPEQMKTLRPPKPILSRPLQEVPPIFAGQDELDENGHINNANYVALVLNTMPEPIRNISRLELNYHHECFAGVPLPRKLYQDEREAFVRLHTPEGAAAFDLYAEY